jgi:hypothetical protein
MEDDQPGIFIAYDPLGAMKIAIDLQEVEEKGMAS